jgi:hypothetical protein
MDLELAQALLIVSFAIGVAPVLNSNVDSSKKHSYIGKRV